VPRDQAIFSHFPGGKAPDELTSLNGVESKNYCVIKFVTGTLLTDKCYAKEDWAVVHGEYRSLTNTLTPSVRSDDLL
jgi:hypothetical protein